MHLKRYLTCSLKPMKKLLCLSLGALVISGCGGSSGPSEYLGQNVALFDPKSVMQIIEKSKIPKAQFLDSIAGMQRAFKVSYIGYNLKKSLIGKSGDEIFAACKVNAAKAPEKLSSLEVYDYVLQCLAGLKDTHVNFNAMNGANTITTGIAEVEYIAKKLYISKTRDNLIKRFEEIQEVAVGSLAAKLKPGTEILAINGAPPSVKINELKKYISASSPAYEDIDAAGDVFSRNYNYPKEKNIVLSLKAADGTVSEAILPWVQLSSNGGSVESRAVLAGKGIPVTSEISTAAGLMAKDGLGLTDSLFDELSSERTFVSEDASEVMVTGIANLQNKNYCYLQLKTFSIPDDKLLTYKIYESVNSKLQALSFPETVKNFLSSCQTFRAPLVLDLRNNNGGNPDVADALYTMLETDKTTKTYLAENMFVSTGNLAFVNGMLDNADQPESGLDGILAFESVKNAKNLPLGDWYLIKKTDLTKSIFTGKVSVLTSPACISACDAIANRFKLSGRAKLIGTPTNGTGFGFGKVFATKTTFNDEMNLYSVEMPNHAFQTAVVAKDDDFKVKKNSKGTVIPFEKLKILENSPTQPDFKIEYTASDLTDAYADYVKALTPLLEDMYK